MRLSVLLGIWVGWYWLLQKFGEGMARTMDKKGGAIMYQTGKELPSSILAPQGDKSEDFENDAYDAAGRFIHELEMLVLFGALMA